MTKFKSWQCQSCGEPIGWTGRFLFPFLHRCLETKEEAAADWARAKRQAKMMLESIYLRRTLAEYEKELDATHGEKHMITTNQLRADEERLRSIIQRSNLSTVDGALAYESLARLVTAATDAPVDSAAWPDQHNRGLLQAAKQAMSVLADGRSTVGDRMRIITAADYLEPAIEREEAWRSAVGDERTGAPSDPLLRECFDLLNDPSVDIGPAKADERATDLLKRLAAHFHPVAGMRKAGRC